MVGDFQGFENLQDSLTKIRPQCHLWAQSYTTIRPKVRIFQALIRTIVLYLTEDDNGKYERPINKKSEEGPINNEVKKLGKTVISSHSTSFTEQLYLGKMFSLITYGAIVDVSRHRHRLDSLWFKSATRPRWTTGRRVKHGQLDGTKSSR